MESKIPKTWEELKETMIYLVDCPAEFFRLDEDEKRYYEYKNQGSREDALKPIYEQLGDEAKFIDNIFPYTRVLQYLPNVLHLTLWNKKGKMSEAEIKKFVDQKYQGKEWCFYERSTDLKSVPEIWHCHVFVKN